MGKLYTIRDACKILQLNPNTLRKWDREGKIKCIRFSNNFRRVPESEINRILGIKNNRMSFIYARVSSHDQKADLDRQIQKLQKHIRNPQKCSKKLKQARGRQRRRIKDALHKQSTTIVREHPDTSFVLEDMKGIRKSGEDKGKRFRTYLNRWPYDEFQKMIEYKSPMKTVYVNPRGTSSECPVCGEKVKHPTWKISRCNNCDRNYDRNRLASMAITLRGIDLCGDPFPVSASASWQSMKDEYLYIRDKPEIPEAGSTETAYAANRTGA